MKDRKMARIKDATPKIIGQEIIPNGKSDGRWGVGVQDGYDQSGIETNRGPGQDCPQHGKEIKSRDKDTNASVTIGTKKIEDIKNTRGRSFLEKLNKWDFVTTINSPIKVDVKIVSDIEKLDFTLIRDFIEKELDKLVDKLISNPTDGWIMAQTDYFRIERSSPEDDRYGTLRINGNKWKDIKSMVKSAPQFNKNFE